MEVFKIIGCKVENRMILRARHFEFTFPRPALIMGILNVTPDSFSDGGQFFNAEAAVQHALDMIREGADIIDIGGESTRPNATPVSEAEELRRVLPVLEKLASQVRVPLSIDTMKPAVARAALEAGASIVNDVAANRHDSEMWQLVAASGAAYVLMHMQGTPQTMQRDPVYQDVVAEVGEFFADKIPQLKSFGIESDQVIFDVGMGFGKTAEHNLQLLGALENFAKWNSPMMVGVSRKAFVEKVAGEATVLGRLPGSLACACWGVAAGAKIIRTHDVAATRQAVRMTEAILAHKK